MEKKNKYEIVDNSTNECETVKEAAFFDSIDFQIECCEEVGEDAETLAGELNDYNEAFKDYIKTGCFEYSINGFTFYINAD